MGTMYDYYVKIACQSELCQSNYDVVTSFKLPLTDECYIVFSYGRDLSLEVEPSQSCDTSRQIFELYVK
jgi:hypothetical protein